MRTFENSEPEISALLKIAATISPSGYFYHQIEDNAIELSLRYTQNDVVSRLQMTAELASETLKVSVEKALGIQAVGVTLGRINPNNPHPHVETRVLYMPTGTPPKTFGNHVSRLYLEDPEAYRRHEDWVTDTAIRLITRTLALTTAQYLMQNVR